MSNRSISQFERTGRQLARRRVLGMVGVFGLAAAGTACHSAATVDGVSSGSSTPDASRVAAPPPRNVLGANINGDTGWSNFAELKAVRATWLRAFFPMPAADKGAVAAQPPIRTLLTAADNGYGTVLSLKFPYFKQAMPTAGSPAMNTALRRLDAVLAAVVGKVDVLVVGNEPFIECDDRNNPQLNIFYESIAQHVLTYRDQHGGPNGKTRIYMGALNHLDEPGWRTATTDRWMTYVRDNPTIDGVDIHPHVGEVNAAKQYLDYILPRLRADQTFLATEFSLVLLWKKHLSNKISSAFATRYRLSPGTPVWQVIRDSIERPFPQQKWNDFLSMSPWFANNQNYLGDQIESFRATGRLAVATYGITQDADMVAHFGPHSTPWLLNSLFCPNTVQQTPNGLPGQTIPWVDQFRAAQ